MTRILLAVLFFASAAVYPAVLNKKKPLIPVILTAAAFAVFFFLYGRYSLLTYAAFGVLFALLTTASFHDIAHKHLRTLHLAGVAAACVAVRLCMDADILSTAISVACGFLSLFVPYLATGKKWLGLGDVVLFSALCLTVEPLTVPVLLLVASLSGLTFHFTGRARGKKNGRIPFVPFLSFSLLVVHPFQSVLADTLAAFFK